MADGEGWLDRRRSWGRPRGLADHRLDANLQHKETVENPNAILGTINRTAEGGSGEAIIPVCAGGSGHMQFYAQSWGLYFKRSTGIFKPVQKSMKRIGCWYLDSTEISLTILLQLALSELLLHWRHRSSVASTRSHVFNVYLTSLSFSGSPLCLMGIILYPINLQA